jgi:hypothetical protein
MRQFRNLALLGLLVAAPLAAQTPATPPAPAPAPVTPAKLDYDSVAFARQLTNWFYSSELDSLWAHTDPEMQQNMGTKEKWTEMIGSFIERAGMEDSLVEERWVKRNGQRQYWRVLRATEFTQEPVVLRWALLPGKVVNGLGMNPLSRVPPIDPN